MKVYVKTRGTSVDYRFLGAVPGERWWEVLSGRYLTEERPAVAARGEGPRWSAAMFGVPSDRRDSRLRTIRYSLVIEAGSQDAELAVRWVRLGLDAAARAELGARLDEIYPAELVDAALESSAQAELPAAARVLAAIRETASTVPGGVPTWSMDPPWAGPDSDARAVDAFLAYAGRLAQGERGLCFTSGSLSTIEQARRAVAQIGDQVGVLALGVQFQGVQSLAEPQGSKSYQSIVERRAGNGSAWRLARPAATSVGLGLAALLVLVLLLRKT